MNTAAHNMLVGAVALAVAMGIGRFAFTPMLPLMQQELLLTLGQSSYVASANYLGYLIGAIVYAAIHPQAVRAARIGLAAVALSTAAMACTDSLGLWLVLRFVAGVTSAFVLIGISAWALANETRLSRTGVTYAGVGFGITLAGLLALAIAERGYSSWQGWVALGIAAGVGALVAACAMSATAPSANTGPEVQVVGPTAPRRSDEWRLIVCYGVFGFGYIVSATYLPAAARALGADELNFGWIWPIFGCAAALSTIVAGRVVSKPMTSRRLWAGAQTIMAFGIALPAAYPGIASVTISALSVGGTFMVATMTGMQEARRLAGANAGRLMARMTIAFALGQVVGPLTVRAAESASEAIRLPGTVAAILLLASAITLAWRRDPSLEQNQASIPRQNCGAT